MQGTIVLTLQLPDNMHRSEDTEMMGGMSIERISVLAGDKAWEDMQNRGGMGGGHADRHAPGPGRDRSSTPSSSSRRACAASAPSSIATCSRSSAAAGLQPTYVAVAEAPEGKADVVEVKNEAGPGRAALRRSERRTCR